MIVIIERTLKICSGNRRITAKILDSLCLSIPTFSINIKNNNHENVIKTSTNRLSSSIKISNKRNTDAITISITSKDPNEAALLVNTLVQVYMNRDLEWITGEMSHLKMFLIEQLSLKEKELKEIFYPKLYYFVMDLAYFISK